MVFFGAGQRADTRREIFEGCCFANFVRVRDDGAMP